MNKELLKMNIPENIFLLKKIQFYLKKIFLYYKSIFDCFNNNKTTIFLECIITICLILLIKKNFAYFFKKYISKPELFFDKNIVNKNIKVSEKMTKVDKLISNFVNSHKILNKKMGFENDDKDNCFFKIAKSYLENHSKNK